MICRRVKMENGYTAFMCGGRAPAHKCACGAKGTKQCDYPMPARSSGTCDRHICDSCATHAGADVDYCPEHKVGPQPEAPPAPPMPPAQGSLL